MSSSLRRTGAQRHLAGFTLMEGLVASGLLAIIGALMATSLSSAIDAKEIVETTSGRYHLVRQAMSRMVDEISMAFLSAHNQTLELRVKTGFKGERDELNFTAFGNVPMREDAKEGDTREIGYYLGRDERTGAESLLRRVDTRLDEEFDEGGRVQTLLPDVIEMELEYFDPTTEEWLDKWDNEGAVTSNRLPARVRITITARMPDGDEQTFTTQTKLWLMQPWAFRN